MLRVVISVTLFFVFTSTLIPSQNVSPLILAPIVVFLPAEDRARKPNWVKPWSGWEPTRVGQAQIQPARLKARKAVWASPGRSLATQGRVQPLPTGQRPVLAWGLLGWCQAQIQPARLKARPPVKARAVLRRGGSSASCRAKHCSGGEPTWLCSVIGWSSSVASD